MTLAKPLKVTLIVLLCLALSACARGRSAGTLPGNAPPGGIERGQAAAHTDYAKSSIWDVFGTDNGDQTVNVNRYLWAASLDVLNFLPVQSVDPFTGVIITGFGTPPGGGQSYRATIHIRDTALEARSLNLALHTSRGPVSASTTRAVEDAILSRARQLRIADNKL